jgi:hypothetical protein
MDKDEVVGVARALQVLARERERCRVDIDGHNDPARAHHRPRQRRPVTGAHAHLEEPVPFLQTKRLVEQRIAVRAGDRRPLAGERKRNLLVGVVPVGRRDEVLATYGEHRAAQALRTQEPRRTSSATFASRSQRRSASRLTGRSGGGTIHPPICLPGIHDPSVEDGDEFGVAWWS